MVITATASLINPEVCFCSRGTHPEIMRVVLALGRYPCHNNERRLWMSDVVAMLWCVVVRNLIFRADSSLLTDFTKPKRFSPLAAAD